MPQIMTASWFTALPRNATRKKGYLRLRALEPGPWFKSASPRRYLTLYSEILSRLDPDEVCDRLLSFGDVPVLLCWERGHDCHVGSKWCHRHLAAQWLEDCLGIEVLEVGFPELDRFAYLENNGIPIPHYRRHSHTSVAKQRPR